jgi:hypothetical protein
MTLPGGTEFSRLVSPDAIGEQGRTMSIEADREECARLAERLGLNRLENLSAEIELTSQKKGRIIHLEGRFQADIQQTCVVTLESIETRIEASFERLYDTTMKTPGDGKAIMDGKSFDTGDDEPPEPLMQGQIELGEAITEQLALEINPFPRKPGISFAGYASGTEDGIGDGIGDGANKTVSSAGPFSGLSVLNKKHKK